MIDSVIHGNVCDLSTKAGEDPTINVCMPAPGSQTLPSSPSQQGARAANRSDSASSDPFSWGAPEKWHRRQDAEMCEPLSIFLYAKRLVQLLPSGWVPCYVLEICLWSPVLEKWHGVNEI